MYVYVYMHIVFASGVMIFGKLLFGFILGSIASTLANMETQKVQYEEKLDTLKVCSYHKYSENVYLQGNYNGTY